MDILNVLVGEHGVLYRQFEYLEQTLPAASTVEEIQALAASLHDLGARWAESLGIAGTRPR